jgi:tricorn protease
MGDRVNNMSSHARSAGFGAMIFAALLLPSALWAKGPLARFPTASTSAIAFVASGDLWIAPLRGGRARRLTEDPGQVLVPHFSPDGRSIAFTWRMRGVEDVYVMPAAGGIPTQLTHGPSTGLYDNIVTGWTPDSKRVLFASQRASWSRKYETYEVPVAGGLAVALGLDHSGTSSLSPDGMRIAYDWSFRNLGGDRWKRYRGGQAGEIFIYGLADHKLERLTEWQGIDTAPMWQGNRIYFLSDRGAEQRLNIWTIDPVTKAARQVTRYTDYDVDMPSIGPGGIAYQQGGRLYLLELPSERLRDVPVVLPSQPSRGVKIVAAQRFVRHEDIVGAADYALGLDGTAYLAVRGDLFSVRADGSCTDLTHTTRAVEEHPAVSPDGRTLAFITDADGEQQVAVMAIDRLGPVRALTHFRSGVLYTPRWSPDGRQLAVADANKRLWLVSTKGAEAKLVASDRYSEIHDSAFSPDGRRLAYSTTRDNQTRAIHLRDLETGKDLVLSAPLESDHDPAFSMDGRSLFFISARKERPFVSDRDREGTIATLASEAVYQATIPEDMGHDMTLFAASAHEVPINLGGGVARLDVHGETLIYAATALRGLGGNLPGQTGGLHAYRIKTHEDQLLIDSPSSYALSPDGKAVLVSFAGRFNVINVSGQGNRALPLDALRVVIEPYRERIEMFEQAWRLDRDLFWDAALNGTDWRSVHDKYLPLVYRAESHEDMLYLIGEMQGELSTSHMFIDGGDSGDPRPAITPARIGADFQLDAASGRYQLAHIYRGDESRSRFRAPLGDPEIGVTDGDYLLAVNGEPLSAPDDPYRLLGHDEQPMMLTVSDSANGVGRNISVTPVSSEREIRKLDWIKANQAFVDRASDGRIGYVYLSDFNELGSEDFVRQYYPQSNKPGLIIDDRENRGGFTSQWVLDLLRRPQAGLFRNREGGVTTLPGAVAPRHMATVIDLFSASDGDQFPYFFRLWGLGRVVGQRTWGGVRGIKGPWTLVDGTTVTVPKDSLLSPSGAMIIEGHGAEPDIPVDDDPADKTQGYDRQLARAVSALIQELSADSNGE